MISIALYAVRPLGRTGCLERKRKANTIGQLIIALSDFEEWGLVPHSEFMDLEYYSMSDLRTDHLSVGSRFMKVYAKHYFALCYHG